MKLIKRKRDPGKTIRLSEQALPMLADLREKMESTTHIGGMKLNPIVKLTDALVLAWSLALANMVMTPQISVIDRKEFTQNLNREIVQRRVELENCTDDERLAKLDLIVASHSEFSGYDPSSPLRAARTGKPA